MTTLVKFGLTGSVLATLSGATYLGINYFSSPTSEISKLIENEYVHILLRTGNNEDTEYWAKNWENYVKNNKNKTKDIFELTGWVSNGSKDLKEELKKKCNILKTSKVYGSSDKLYKNVTDYCSRFVTVKDEAEKKGLTILDTTGDASRDVWTQKNTGKASLEADIKLLGMIYESIDANGIKNGCGTSITKSKELSNYEALYKSYEKVCTNPKT